jgi:twitching motility protein PilT
VHLTAGLLPRYRVGGSIKPIPGHAETSDAELRKMLLSVMPARVRQEFEETKDADFAYAIEGLSRFRCNVAEDRHGIFSVIRRIPFEILTPEQIGLPKKVLDLCFLTKGLVLVTGPTGSGKSTTLATMIDFVNSSRADHIITIEDPVEFVHPDTKKCLIRQREVGEHTGSFKRALKAALREDPNIVLVGEMRDLETIAIAIETAETGHLVFGTLHTSTAPSTVDRIIDQFPADRQEQIRVMLSESLKGVIAQTLCKKIGGGRVAAYEILLGSKAVSNLIREGKTFQLYSLMQTQKGVGMVTLNDSLMQLVKAKVVAPEEAYMKAVNKDELKMMFEKVGLKVDLSAMAEDV